MAFQWASVTTVGVKPRDTSEVYSLLLVPPVTELPRIRAFLEPAADAVAEVSAPLVNAAVTSMNATAAMAVSRPPRPWTLVPAFERTSRMSPPRYRSASRRAGKQIVRWTLVRRVPPDIPPCRQASPAPTRPAADRTRSTAEK